MGGQIRGGEGYKEDRKRSSACWPRSKGQIVTIQEGSLVKFNRRVFNTIDSDSIACAK
jgi:hypothetical protein